MYNRTELTDAILKSKKAKEILGWMPQVYGDAYAFLWLIEVIGSELEELEGWSKDLENQVVPQTATWSLPYWEERFDLPINPEAPLEKRRMDVLMRMWQRAPMNPYKLETMLSGLTGLSASVLENTGKNHFTVVLEGYTGVEPFHQAVDVLEQVKPAHLIYNLLFHVPMECKVHTGAAITRKRIYQLETEPVQKEYRTECCSFSGAALCQRKQETIREA